MLQFLFPIQRQLLTTVKNSLDPTVITFNLHWTRIMVKQRNTGLDTWKWCACRQWYIETVQENNFEMWLRAWAYWIPFYFSTNLFNYAHYGTFYLETLKNIQKNYPDLKELLSGTGLSVQGQDRYAHRAAIDQHGEHR